MRPFVLFFIVSTLWGSGCALPPLPPSATEPEILIEQGRYSLALKALTGPEAYTAYLRSKAEAGIGELEASLHSAEHALEQEPKKAIYHVQVRRGMWTPR